MPDFSRAKIYAIVSPSLFKCYIGSTCVKHLCQRIGGHRNDKAKHCMSRILFEQPDVKYFLIENYPCETGEQLRRREGEIIQAMGDMCVNKCIAGRTRKETVDASNKKRSEIINEHMRANHQKNKEAIHIRKNRVLQCECGASITSANMSAHKRTIKHNKLINN